MPSIEPLVGISSMVFYASTLLFAFIALPAIYRPKAGMKLPVPAAQAAKKIVRALRLR